jgi:hypothetical protein
MTTSWSNQDFPRLDTRDCTLKDSYWDRFDNKADYFPQNHTSILLKNNLQMGVHSIDSIQVDSWHSKKQILRSKDLGNFVSLEWLRRKNKFRNKYMKEPTILITLDTLMNVLQPAGREGKVLDRP